MPLKVYSQGVEKCSWWGYNSLQFKWHAVISNVAAFRLQTINYYGNSWSLAANSSSGGGGQRKWHFSDYSVMSYTYPPTRVIAGWCPPPHQENDNGRSVSTRVLDICEGGRLPLSLGHFMCCQPGNKQALFFSFAVALMLIDCPCL